jgi:hypothetical protein
MRSCTSSWTDRDVQLNIRRCDVRNRRAGNINVRPHLSTHERAAQAQRRSLDGRESSAAGTRRKARPGPVQVQGLTVVGQSPQQNRHTADLCSYMVKERQVLDIDWALFILFSGFALGSDFFKFMENRGVLSQLC